MRIKNMIAKHDLINVTIRKCMDTSEEILYFETGAFSLNHRHCLQEAHAPCTCELWSKWSKKIAEMMPKIPTTKG